MNEKLVSKWTELSMEAPINQTTGRRYHPQTLARVARGEVVNVQLRAWLETKGLCHAKKKEGRNRNGKSFGSSNDRLPEVSEELRQINKSIEGSLSHLSRVGSL